MRKERHIQRRETMAYWPAQDTETGEAVGIVVDLTEEGLQLHTQRSFRPGEVLEVQIAVDAKLAGIKHIPLLLTNIWCKEGEESHLYHAGFQVTQLSDQARVSIHCLMQAFSYPAPDPDV